MGLCISFLMVFMLSGLFLFPTGSISLFLRLLLSWNFLPHELRMDMEWKPTHAESGFLSPERK